MRREIRIKFWSRVVFGEFRLKGGSRGERMIRKCVV